VARGPAGRLAPDQPAALRVLLDQVSVALRNTRLYGQANNWAVRLAALQSAGTEIGATLDLHHVLHAAVHQAMALVGANLGAVALWNPQSRMLTAQAAVPGPGLLDPPGLTAAAGAGLAGQVVEVGRTLLRDPTPRPAGGFTPALVALPLIWQGDLLGVLQVGDSRPTRHFSADDRALLTLLGQQTAGAIANARLYERAQERLRQLTVLQDTSRAIISQLDPDTILRTVLRQVTSLLGTGMGAVYTPSEPWAGIVARAVVGVGGVPGDTLPPGLADSVRRVLDRGKMASIPDLYEEPAANPRGLPPEVRALLAVPLISGGRVLGAICVYASQPRLWSPVEAELLGVFASQAAHALQNALLVERLRAEKATLTTTIMSMSDGLVVTDAEGRLILANPVTDRLFGVGFTGGEGELLPALLASSPYQLTYRGGAAPDLVGLVLGQGVPYRGELDVRGPAPATLEFSFVPVLGMGAQITGGLAVFHDITELRRIDTLKNDFISMVSHELRTPLTSIKGFVKLVVMGDLGPLNTQQQECLSVADREADRLTRLINDLLDLSRIEAGTLTFHWETVDPAPLVADVLRVLRPQVDAAGLTLNADLPPDLPVMRADRQRLTQILTNLVGNAIKFTAPGGQVQVRAGVEEDRLVLAVSDTGMGIPSHALAHVFDRFYQVDTGETRARGGTGLGLAITRQLVEGHGGSIQLHSVPNEGTTVTVTLPLGDV
jgi:signal transduction histidine kinase/GAF domain-containing protein